MFSDVMLGNLQVKLGNYEEAIKYLKIAADSYRSVDAQKILGMLYAIKDMPFYDLNAAQEYLYKVNT
jgi:hypothetical protein